MPIVNSVGPRTRDNVVTYLGIDVYTAAKQRIRHILNTCDSLVVAFSGGKDSLAALHLVREVQAEEGITTPVNALFRDEELIPNCIIDFVNEYRQKDWIKLLWFAVPLASQKFILGKTYDYVQWDWARDWVRPKPEWAITTLPGYDDRTVFSQTTMDDVMKSYFPGKVCVVTGIRCQESIFRYQAIMNKINDTVVAASSAKGVVLGRPIYDWTENDIFKFFYDKKIQYCRIYDDQNMNGEILRVATPIHGENVKRIHVLRSRDPEFYDRVLKVFPDVALQELYYKDLDREALISAYGGTWDDVFRYCDEHMTDPKQHALATSRVKQCIAMSKTTGGYTPRYVVKVLMAWSYKRVIQADIKPCSK